MLIAAAALGLQPGNVRFALVDDRLDHFDHSRIMREGHDLAKLRDPAAHVLEKILHALRKMAPAAKDTS